MFGKPGKSRISAQSKTALDVKQQALREKEEKLRLHQLQLERLIHEAPKMKEEQARRIREQRAHDPRLSNTVIMDKHAYHVSTMANLGRRPLRSEKREGLFLFLFLIAVLASIVFWIFRLVL